MKINKFKIIIPSFNNEDFIEYNIASILNQTYTNYDVLYIDDASTDNTYYKVEKIVGDLKNWKIIKNKENKGGIFNYFDTLDGYIEDKEEIIIHLDGDDWFYDENVLEKLNTFYNNKDCWMTYGGFLCFDGSEIASIPYPQSTEYSDFVHTHKMYRKDEWRASHMRTYKAFLVQSINKEDLKSLIDNKYYWHAGDLAIQFIFLEMCPKDKIGVVDFYTYIYNQSKQNAIRTRERERETNFKYELEIRNRKKYAEGLSGKKLPQINVIGYYQETNYIPKDFSYVYDSEIKDYDATIITDSSLLPYLLDQKKLPKGKIIADIHESDEYSDTQKMIYDLIYNRYQLFDLILTYNEKLLELPNAELRFCMWRCLNKNIHTKEWPIISDESLYKIYSKTKNISCISSNKSCVEGNCLMFSTTFTSWIGMSLICIGLLIIIGI
jgi:glycosyltransferase involved in cell wall biosynthesis